MHINVSHILSGEIGESADFEIAGENPNIPDLELTKPLTGQIVLTKLEDDLRLKGHVRLSFKLECYRCLNSYIHDAEVPLQAIFSLKPDEDEWPISQRAEIDLAPLIRQEALLRIPVQQLCRADCLGLCVDCGQPRSEDHGHIREEMRRQPRIKPAAFAQGTKRKDK